MQCPRCGDEYVDGVLRCPDCDRELVADGTVPAQLPDVALGTFHPQVAALVSQLLARQGIAHHHEVIDPDPNGAVLLLVDERNRDAVRGELVAKWASVIGAIHGDVLFEILKSSGSGGLPGWRDAPSSVWVDRDGKFNVEDAEQASFDDATRVVGPSLAALGGIMLVFGWYANTGAGVLVIAALAIVVGLFLPI